MFVFSHSPTQSHTESQTESPNLSREDPAGIFPLTIEHHQTQAKAADKIIAAGQAIRLSVDSCSHLGSVSTEGLNGDPQAMVFSVRYLHLYLHCFFQLLQCSDPVTFELLCIVASGPFAIVQH